jgi:hypothetical protein
MADAAADRTAPLMDSAIVMAVTKFTDLSVSARRRETQMTKRAILVVALLLPALVHADDLVRWRDARGRIHYSNDTARIPEGGKPITTQLGMIGGAPIGAVVEPTVVEGPTAARSAASSWTGGPSCGQRLSTWALPQGIVDLDRPYWYYVDGICGPQHDIEGWLRRAAMQIQFREIGL